MSKSKVPTLNPTFQRRIKSATSRKKPIKINPRFWMKGWRTLRPREEVEKEDLRWSHVKKCWIPVIKDRIGEMAGVIHTFIRREEEMANPCSPPKGHRFLQPKEKIKYGDYFWAVSWKRFIPVLTDEIGKEAGTICTAIRKVKS